MSKIMASSCKHHQNKQLIIIEKELNELANLIESSGLSHESISHMIDQVFTPSDHDHNHHHLILTLYKSLLSCLKLSWQIFCILLMVLLMSLTLLALHHPSQKLLLRHSQDLIYPVMRQVRLWTLPVIRKYSHLSQWHVEECLVQNPFYVGSKLECWPCQDIRTVVDLTGLHNYSSLYAIDERPFLVKDVMNESISWQSLRLIYISNEEALEFGTSQVTSNLIPLSSRSSHTISDLSSLMSVNNLSLKSDLHIVWKMKRVEAARVMRRVFKRPHFVPHNSEVALEKYIFIDGFDSPQYRLPLTDFANVWLTQAQGYRLIVLDPSETCKHNCSTVSIVLRPKDVLYYNWQFYRPRSLPARLVDQISITFMASFY